MRTYAHPLPLAKQPCGPPRIRGMRLIATLAGGERTLERAGEAKPPPPSLEDTSLPLPLRFGSTTR